MAQSAFEVICEIEPAVTPDLRKVRHQIGVLSAVSTVFLVPDNHIGRATVSSIAVAREVIQMGGRAIACLNARDRNTLGFRRDMLTGAAHGVDEFLFVYGDRPESGRRSDDLNVRRMLQEARRVEQQHRGDATPFRLGVASGLSPLPAWKHAADFVFAQVCFSVEQVLEWRATVEFDGPVYAGVLVVGSARMAAKLSSEFPQLTAPPWLVERLEHDQYAGVEFACKMVRTLRDSGAFDGVHLVPAHRYRDVARRLEVVL